MSETSNKPVNFIQEIIDEDKRTNRYGGRVHTGSRQSRMGISTLVMRKRSALTSD